jgi:hypothetical protein
MPYGKHVHWLAKKPTAKNFKNTNKGKMEVKRGQRIKTPDWS